MSRRSRAALEKRIGEANPGMDKANAHFDLAVFHDNNSREAEAIPHYEAALTLGIEGEARARCLAWLASSLSKTSRPAAALQRLEESREVASDAELRRFLNGLERRLRLRSDRA
jgi:hypothetical protein